MSDNQSPDIERARHRRGKFARPSGPLDPPVADRPVWMGEVLPDQNGDGFPDYLNATIYVEDRASAEDLAAAANIAARLSFEALSLDLPLGATMSDFDPDDTAVAIVVGRAAAEWTRDRKGIVRTHAGARTVLAISSADEAEHWARTLGEPLPRPPNSVRGLPANARPRPVPVYSLGEIFTPSGLLGQSPDCAVPNFTNTMISIGPGVHSPGIIDLAARIALESAGITIPVAAPWHADQNHPNPILVGQGHPRLTELSGTRDLDRTRGLITTLPFRSRDGCALVIQGPGAGEETTALRYVAGSVPNVSEYGKGQLQLRDIESEISQFLALRTPEGQAIAGINRLRRVLQDASGGPDPVRPIRLCIDGKVDLDGEELRHMQLPETTVEDTGVASGQEIFARSAELEWEVDALRARLRTTVHPVITPGAKVELDIGVSESPDIRRRLARELTAELVALGARPESVRVRVLSAFKQAYHWIDEILKPRMRGARTITIRTREAGRGSPHLIDSPARWIQELYPIDEVLARDLRIPTDAVRFETTRDGPTYQVLVRDGTGAVILEEDFEPVCRMRPVFAEFPDYAETRVSTGWVRAQVDGTTRLDERIPTDIEAVWDAFEHHGLSPLATYFTGLYTKLDGASFPPPHFANLEVDIALSEPDYAIGIDQERISTPEALHEDIYFNTLLFIEILAENRLGFRLDYPGRIVPRIRVLDNGGGPRVSVRLTGKTTPTARVEIPSLPSQEDTAWHSDLSPRPMPRCRVRRASLGSPGADITLGIDCERPPRSVEPLAGWRHEAGEMLDLLGSLHHRGRFTTTLRFAGVGGFDITFGDSTAGGPSLSGPAAAPGGASRMPPQSPSAPAPGHVPDGRGLNSSETEREVRRLSAFPGVRAYRAGRSRLGRPIHALDVTSAVPGRYVSQARLTISKPVLFVTGRQHGNEVSSTSHILKVVEWLVSTPEGGRLLARVNLVAQPMSNPDGADLACELGRDNPDFMLHAGYFGALGVDVMRDQWTDDTVYPETRVRRELWDAWRPDIVLDPHGYPSHEWVQLLGGYAAWFRSRERIHREWWIPRGAFIPRFETNPDTDDSSSQNTSARTAVHAAIARALSDELGDVNRRMYARYRKYMTSCGLPSEWSTLEGLMVSTPPHPTRKGSPDARRRESFVSRAPHITLAECTIELPDETARGEWLGRLIDAGFSASIACLEALAAFSAPARRTSHSDGSVLLLRTDRPRGGHDDPSVGAGSS